MKKSYIAWFVGQITMLVLFSLSILAMYFVEFLRSTQYELLYLRINGIVFWASALLLLLTSIIVCILRKRDTDFEKEHPKYRPGCIRVFQNTPAKVADIATAITGLTAIILFILDMKILIPRGIQVVVFVSISLFILSFGMHCILNGINFEYLVSNKGGEKSERVSKEL